MTLPEKIEEALQNGCLEFMSARRLFRLYEERRQADIMLQTHKGDKHLIAVIESTSNEIVKILNNSSLSMSEKLKKANHEF